MEEMELELPRAKKEVWERRRVVRVIEVGERSRRAVEVRIVGKWGMGMGKGRGLMDLLRKKNWRRKRR